MTVSFYQPFLQYIQVEHQSLHIGSLNDLRYAVNLEAIGMVPITIAFMTT